MSRDARTGRQVRGVGVVDTNFEATDSRGEIVFLETTTLEIFVDFTTM